MHAFRVFELLVTLACVVDVVGGGSSGEHLQLHAGCRQTATNKRTTYAVRYRYGGLIQGVGLSD